MIKFSNTAEKFIANFASHDFNLNMCTCRTMIDVLEYKPMDETFAPKMKNRLKTLDAIFTLVKSFNKASFFKQGFSLLELASEVKSLSKTHGEKIAIHYVEELRVNRITTQYEILFVFLATWTRYAEDVQIGYNEIIFQELRLTEPQKVDFTNDLNLLTISGFYKTDDTTYGIKF